jgi:predicted O-methyltransferase YrrM
VSRFTERLRDRLRSSRAARGAARATSHIVVRTLNPGDATLAAVVRALRSPSGEEDRWTASIEAVRGRLEASDEELRYPVQNGEWWEQVIAASNDPQPPVLHEDHAVRTLGEVTRSTSKPGQWGRFLYRIVRELRPERCLELGTSVGMSGCYIAAGLAANARGRLITIEGEEAPARVAREVFEQAALGARVEVRVGQFADEMPAALDSLGEVELAFIDGHHQYAPTMNYFTTILEATVPGGLLVFDDITYIRDMKAAWRDIRADSHVTGSMTIGTVGFAVIGGQRAEHRRVPLLTVPA